MGGDLSTQVEQMGQNIARMMEIAGLDPRNASHVDSFVNGLRITSRIKDHILDKLDDE